jgi:hypothetical protein
MIRTTLLLFFGFISFQLSAQNLTGRWVGSFIANEDALINNYAYQIELKENSSHQIAAQTITQKGDQFYASAFARGSHSLKTNLVQITETSFDQIKIANQLEACLMTNFLTYKNIDGHEILEGTYMSTSLNGKRNCGSGKIFLEKEASLLSVTKNKKENKVATNTQYVNVDSQKSINKLNSTKINTSNKDVSGMTSSKIRISKAPDSKGITSNANPSFKSKDLDGLKTSTFNNKQIIETPSKPTSEIDTDEVIEENTINSASTNKQNINNNTPINLPWVLVGRENKLVKKISTKNKKVSIDLFDNGTIDNDTIIVYDNKQLIVNKKRLSYKSIHLEFDFTDNMREHEVIIVAHNMGSVPPNTALLLYKDGKNRQEYFITSTNKINAKLLIVYEPDKSD